VALDEAAIQLTGPWPDVVALGQPVVDIVAEEDSAAARVYPAAAVDVGLDAAQPGQGVGFGFEGLLGGVSDGEVPVAGLVTGGGKPAN
jgi:hypothetical protein